MKLSLAEVDAAKAPLPLFWNVQHGKDYIAVELIPHDQVDAFVIKSLIAYSQVSKMRKEAEYIFIELLKYKEVKNPLMVLLIQDWLKDYGDGTKNDSLHD